MDIATSFRSTEKHFSLRNHSSSVKMLDGIKIEDHIRTAPSSLGIMLGEYGIFHLDS